MAVASGIGVVGAIIGGIAFFFFWYHNSYKSELQIVDIPSQGLKYVLMTDMSGFEDPAWYIYEVKRGAEPPPTIRVAHDGSEAAFWNYDEANDLVDEPHLTVVADRFLVFSRSGLRVSLYDIVSQCVLVNDESPWASYVEAGGDSKFGPDGQRSWIRATLDQEIGQRIAPSNQPMERTPPCCARRRRSSARWVAVKVVEV